jgi:hypothetical protein
MYSFLKPDELAAALTRFADGAGGSARPPLPIHTAVESARAMAALRATAAPPPAATASPASPFRRGFTPAAAPPRVPAGSLGADLDAEFPPDDCEPSVGAEMVEPTPTRTPRDPSPRPRSRTGGAAAPAAALSAKDLAAANALAAVQRRDEAIFAAFDDVFSLTNAQFRELYGLQGVLTGLERVAVAPQHRHLGADETLLQWHAAVALGTTATRHASAGGTGGAAVAQALATPRAHDSTLAAYLRRTGSPGG